MARLSLTHRLTLFFTLISAALLLGLGGVFMYAADQHFLELDRAALQDKQHLIEDILASIRTEEDARIRLAEVLGHHHGLFASVRNAQGMPVFVSPGFVSAEPLLDLPASAGARVEMRTIRTGQGRIVRAWPFSAQTAQSGRFDVVLAMDTAHHSHFLSDLQRHFAAYALTAMLLSAMLGWLAAHQGLAPLRAMQTRAAGVSAQRFDARMPVDSVPVEMAELAVELNRMLDRLQSDFTRLQDFSSDLAHELRTPISNLLTQTQVSLSAPRAEAVYRDILASNAEELQRLARMVSDMLFLAKTERGIDLPHAERFAVAAEVRALLEFYEALAQERQVDIRMSGAAWLEGDRLMFRRAVSNLLSNAVRHTPAGGVVQVRIEHAAHHLCVSVENTGDAIDAQALPRLFDRFYRADPARRHPDADGAGLGLPITRAIVQAHGGSIDVYSEADCTRFTLRFPLKHHLASLPPATAPAA